MAAASLQRRWAVPAVLLGALLVSRGPLGSLAQQSTPLQGQGIPPWYRSPNPLDYIDLPVYTSVELVRLQEIDDRSYEFKAIFDVQQTWFDPEAPAAFAIINEQDLLLNAARPDNLYNASLNCANATVAAGKPLNMSSPACLAALPSPPGCQKYCTTYGQGTDNPYRCCDLIWLPNIVLSNLIDTSQDRNVYDAIFPLSLNNITYVHRTTRVQGRFYTPLEFKRYPFDKQQLNVFFERKIDTREFNIFGIHIVPSATFRRLIPSFGRGPKGELEVSGLSKDELAGWNITNIIFNCTKTPVTVLQDTINFDVEAEHVNGAKLWLKNQDYDADDPYAQFVDDTSTSGRYGSFQNLIATCAFSVQVSRLSSTLFAQSILPVLFVGALAFVVFLSPPDALDLRLSTEVSLFLALTAVQFIFVSMLPLASYLTAFDIFILLTYCTIVAIVVESLVVHYISTREEVEERRSASKSRGYTLREPELGSSQLRSAAELGYSNGFNAAQVLYKRAPQPAASPRADHTEARKHQDQNSNDSVLLPDSTRQMEEGIAGPAPGEADANGGSTQEEPKSTKFSFQRTLAYPARFATPVHLPKVTAAIKEADNMFAQDSAFAYRVSRKIDVAAGAFLFFMYLLLSIINFTVGFNSKQTD